MDYILTKLQLLIQKIEFFTRSNQWVKPVLLCLPLLFLSSGFTTVKVVGNEGKNHIELNADSHSFQMQQVVEGTHTTTVSFLVIKDGVKQTRLLNVVVDYITPERKSVSLAIAAKGTKTSSHYVKITTYLSSLDGSNVVELNTNKYSLQITEAKALCNIQ